MVDDVEEFEEEVIAKLKQLMKAEYPKLAGSLIRNTQGNINELGEALKSKDTATATASAHKMKSACGQFGLMHLQSLAKQIEYFEGSADGGRMAIFEKLQPAYDKALVFLQKHGME